MEAGGFYGDSTENLKALRITQLDDDYDDDNEAEAGQEPITIDEGDDDEDEGDDDEPVTLGFVERPKYKWSLLRQLYPHKAGGIPAWLDPVNLPTGRSILCDLCEEPLQFGLQVYAPTMDKESAFHRTLFLFMCPSMSCILRDQHEQWKRAPEKALRGVKVFRCQLPRVNPFYSSEPPKHNGTDKPLGDGAALCSWCGTWRGDKLCSNCRTARYCSQKHQVMHWRSGHKTECQQLSIAVESYASNVVRNGASPSETQKVACKSLWPEYELVNTDESEFDTEMSEDDGLSNSLISRGEVDDKMKSLMNDFEGSADRKSWASFQERLVKAPEQVLRYCRSPNAKPLWPMSSGRLAKADTPKCSSCGGPMCFEFQVLPQLLYYFGVKNEVDSLDWATIAVYTCENSCESSISYKQEFVWVQLYDQTA